jgi:hypothetical protein
MSFDVGPSHSRIVSASRALRWLVIVLFVFVASSASAAGPTQRMRIPVGEYWINGGGSGGDGGGGGAGLGGGGGNPAPTPSGGGSSGGQISLPSLPASTGDHRPTFELPAYCIDEGRSPPATATPHSSATLISHVSGAATVFQYQDQKQVDQKSLNDAISGTDAWLQISGLDTATTLSITPNDPKYTYKLVVSGLAIAGESSSDVEPTYSDWTHNAGLMEVSKSFDEIRTALLNQSGTSGLIQAVEGVRQHFEWQQLGDAHSGAVIPNTISKAQAATAFDKAISSDFEITPNTLTPTDRLAWLTLLSGSSFGSNQLSAIAKPFAAIGLEIPLSYSFDVGNPALLQSFSQAYSQGLSDLARFRYFRTDGELNFSAAIREASYAAGDESIWTTGQPELAFFKDLGCDDGLGFSTGTLDADNDAEEGRMVKTLTNLMKSLAGYSNGFNDSKLMKVVVAQGQVCFVHLRSDNTVERQILPLAALTRDFVRRNYANSTIVIDDDDGDSADELRAHGIAFKKYRDVVVAQSRNAFRARDDALAKRLEHFARASDGFDLTMLNLETRGDAIITRMPDGSVLLIDTGLGSDTVAKFSQFLTHEYGSDRPPLRLVITHSHQDHIGGLRQLVEAGYQIQELLIGRSQTDGGALDRLAPLFAQGDRVDLKDGDEPGVTHFVRTNVSPLFRPDTRDVSWDGGVESWTFHMVAGVQIEVHHVVNARSPNEAGLVVRLGYRGMHWLLCDDLNPAAQVAMMNGLDDDQLQAGILKWPHHLWFPAAGTSERRTLEHFIRAVSPHTIIFSNTGHQSHDRAQFLEIKRFVADTLGPEVATIWTRDIGRHVVMKAELKSNLHDLAVSAFGRDLMRSVLVANVNGTRN